jgi:hypothetical protein
MPFLDRSNLNDVELAAGRARLVESSTTPLIRV